MVEVSEVRQRPTFHSLCHDLLFHGIFIIFQTDCDINYL